MDNFANFATATVSGTYDSTTTNIGLTAGQLSLFPNPPFNAVWYNSTDYNTPNSDANKEIVRVTGVSGSNNFIVIRGQEGIAATTKNTAGKTYTFFAPLTAKTLADVSGGFYSGISSTGGIIKGFLQMGFGDSQSMYFTPNSGSLLQISSGTFANPDTLTYPLVKVERYIQQTQPNVTGDGAIQLASFFSICESNTFTNVQPVGVVGAAVARGTGNTSSTSPDACGLYGVGRVVGSGLGVGIGIFANGRRETVSGKANPAQFNVDNQTTGTGRYTTGSFPDTVGIWLTPGGTAGSAAGLVLGNPFGQQFDVGIAANCQITNSVTGAIKNTFIRDDSSALESYLVTNARTGAAIHIMPGAGFILVNGNNRVNSSSLLECLTTTTWLDPIAVFAGTTNEAVSVKIGNNINNFKLFQGSSANNFVPGVAAQDNGILLPLQTKQFIIGNLNGVIMTILNTGNNGAISFFGLPPTGMQSTSTDFKDNFVNYGLLSGGGVTNFNMDTGVLTTAYVQADSGVSANDSGRNLYIRAGAALGSGNPGDILISTSITGGAGSSLNGYAPRYYTCGKPLILTNNAFNKYCTMTLTSGKYVAGCVLATVHAFDGADMQCRVDSFNFAVVNRTGQATGAFVSSSFGSGLAATAGSLAALYSVSGNGQAIDFYVKPNTSLTTKRYELTFQMDMNGNETGIITHP